MTFETELYYALPCEMVVAKLGFKCHVNVTAMPNSSHMTFLKFYALFSTTANIFTDYSIKFDV